MYRCTVRHLETIKINLSFALVISLKLYFQYIFQYYCSKDSGTNANDCNIFGCDCKSDCISYNKCDFMKDSSIQGEDGISVPDPTPQQENRGWLIAYHYKNMF